MAQYSTLQIDFIVTLPNVQCSFFCPENAMMRGLIRKGVRIDITDQIQSADQQFNIKKIYLQVRLLHTKSYDIPSKFSKPFHKKTVSHGTSESACLQLTWVIHLFATCHILYFTQLLKKYRNCSKTQILHRIRFSIRTVLRKLKRLLNDGNKAEEGQSFIINTAVTLD